LPAAGGLQHHRHAARLIAEHFLSTWRIIVKTLLALLFIVCVAWPSAGSPALRSGTGQAPLAGDVRDLPLVERWRAGGDDDEDVFFGNVLQVLPAPDGGLYVLDSQLVQVFAFTATGELRTVLGGRGEGPGEVNNVNSIVNMPDGDLGIGQVLPGVLACVRPDGTPTRKIRIRDREDADSAFVLYMDGWPLGDGILAIAMRWRFLDQGVMAQEMSLRSYDPTGAPLVEFLHKETSFDMSDFRFTEQGYDFVWNRCGVLPDGNVCFAAERDAYAITVCRPDGSLVRTLTRPYRSLQRTDAEREDARLSHAAIASHYGREVREVGVEDTQAAITGLVALHDGALRVRTGRGDAARDPGVLTTVDEFDADGRFVGQRRLLAPGDPRRDAIHMLPDGRVVVVTGAVEAYRREQNTERAADVLDTETPLAVICYGPE
jgi:hypothetical protein